MYQHEVSPPGEEEWIQVRYEAEDEVVKTNN